MVQHWKLNSEAITYNSSTLININQRLYKSMRIDRIVRPAYPNAPDQFAHQLKESGFTDNVHAIKLQNPLKLGCSTQMIVALVYTLDYKAENWISPHQRNMHSIERQDESHFKQ